MRKMGLLKALVLFCTLCSVVVFSKKPNFVVFLADDMGYGDVGVYGSKTIDTPNIDKLAHSGMVFKQFYAAASVCTPSRAGLMTGRHPINLGFYGSSTYFRVLFPWSVNGLPENATTIPGKLKEQGYASMLVGKWHLGHKGSLPTQRGFDKFYGIPYSHDMSTGMYGMKNLPLTNRLNPYLPLFHDEHIIEQPTQLNTLTHKLTKHAISFLHHQHQTDEPFFLVVSYYQPHHPAVPSQKFQGVSRRGSYGDFVMEMDDSVGKILKFLDESGLRDNTMTVFTSDNGPWTLKAAEAGSSGGLRGGKGDTWEGGYRVPGIFSWPGKIPVRTSFAVSSFLDLYDTILDLAGTSDPAPGRGGVSLKSVLLSDRDPIRFSSHPSNHRLIIYSFLDKIMAIRKGDFKVHFMTHKSYNPDPPKMEDPPLVFNIEEDPYEHFPLTDEDEPRLQQILSEFSLLYNNLTHAWKPPSLFGDREIFAAPCCRLGNIENPCICTADDSSLGEDGNSFIAETLKNTQDVSVADFERQELEQLLEPEVIARVFNEAPVSMKPLLRVLFPDVFGSLTDDEVKAIVAKTKQKLQESSPPCDGI